MSGRRLSRPRRFKIEWRCHGVALDGWEEYIAITPTRLLFLVGFDR